ncbi:MAG TPA: DsbE family thiol:disulfide interchange protein [Gammaproteobacteria bacterium]|nr:DsbE family thiol:disulfide interchange protein [Gammaproteobacteria bacterium]
MLRLIVSFIVFGLLVLLLWAGLGMNPRELPSPLVGRPAPVFELPELMDRDSRFQHQALRGQASLFNVWASWCVSCRAEHGLLMELARAGVPIYGLNYKDTRTDAIAYLRQGGNPYRAIGFDEAGQVGIDWGVYGTPETFVIGPDGVIRYKHVGPLSRRVLTETILPLLQSLDGASS